MAYEGISSFLQYKRQTALHNAVQVMENKVDFQCSRVFHLEDSVTMYDIYNSDTLETLIDTDYTINLLLFLTTVRQKYVKMYERFINQLRMCTKVKRILSKGYLPISLLPPSKLRKNITRSKGSTSDY